jgi:magnesium transporter
MTATTLGTFSPFVFARLGIDPAVASGPIVTAFNDVLSTLCFFLVARVLHLFFS